jgi:hypothetical protein
MNEKPKAKAGQKCPFYGKDVSKVCHTCEFYEPYWGRSANGKTPDDMGEIVSEHRCSLKMLTQLSIQEAREQWATHKAVSDLRDEIKKQDTETRLMLASAMGGVAETQRTMVRVVERLAGALRGDAPLAIATGRTVGLIEDNSQDEMQ